MRIAMILENPLFFGGGEIHAYEISKNLVRLGHDVDFIQMYGTPRVRALRRNEALSPSRWIVQPNSQFFEALYTRALWLYSYLDAPMMYKELLRSKYDILHIHGLCYASPLISAILAKKTRAGSKIVCTLHNNLARHIDRRIIKLYASRVDAFIAVSRSIQRRWLTFCGLKSFHIPNGVDINRFNPKADGSQIKKKLGIQDKFVVLSIGRLSRQKGLKYLIQATSQLRGEIENLVVLIGGRGEQERYLKKLSRSLGLEETVKFLGFIPSALLPEFYAACDVFVLPSIFETFALTLLEAISVGKPVIVSKVGGAKELAEELQKEIGAKIVQPRNAYQIAEAISWCFDHKEVGDATKNALTCYKYVRKFFSWEEIAERTVAVYNELE